MYYQVSYTLELQKKEMYTKHEKNNIILMKLANYMFFLSLSLNLCPIPRKTTRPLRKKLNCDHTLKAINDTS